MTNEPKERSILPLILVGTPLAILLARYVVDPLGDKIEAGYDKVSARELASAYVRHRDLAKTGNVDSKNFIQAANRRLSKLRDDALLGDARAKTFLDEASRLGVTESDYLK